MTTATWLALVALCHPAPQPVYHSGKIYQAETVAYYCDRFKIQNGLGMALVREESSFRIRLETRSWVGKGKHRRYVVLSHGMTQTNPRYEKEFASAVGLRSFDWRNPVQSARVGLGRLAFLLRYFNGDHALAVAAYNAGIARIESRLSIPDETIVFLGRVLGKS
jgi:hypothetical protein